MRTDTSLLRHAVALTALALSAACEGAAAPAAPPPVDLTAVARVQLSDESVDLLELGSRHLSVVARNAVGHELPGKPIAWTSSDSSVAVVTEAGAIFGRRIGSATIVASSEGKADSVLVRVIPVTVDRIHLVATELRLQSGEFDWIAPVLLAADGRVLLDREITYSSSAPLVASVENGKVMAKAPGVAVITVSSEGRSATIRVEVTAPAISGRYALSMWNITGNGTTCYLNGMELSLAQAGTKLEGSSAPSESGMSAGCSITGGGEPPFSTPQPPAGEVIGDVVGTRVRLMLEVGWWLDGTLRADGSIGGTLRYEEIVNGQPRQRTGVFQLTPARSS